MTATEVQVRYEMMQRLLGPTLGRFQSEFLNPLIERVFGIMLRDGALGEAPEILTNQQMDIEYVGPLARSQRMEEGVAIERLYQMAFNIAQVDPSIMDNIDHDAAVRLRATLLGVPKSIMRDPDEIEEQREAQAMAQAQQQQMAQAQQATEAVGAEAEAAQKMADPQVQDMMQQAQQQMEQG